jgi:acetyl-CoA acetyltransferase
MSSHRIADRVAIIGMGCTPFGEHWGRSAEDLLIDAQLVVDQIAEGHLPRVPA